MITRSSWMFWLALSVLTSCTGTPSEESPTPSPSPDTSPTPVPTVTWYGQMQPLIERACVSCHVEGGIAPFALETYDQAKIWSAMLNREVQAGTMPPWMPSPDCQSFKYARVLTAEEKSLFQSWYEQGSPEGQPSQAQTTMVPQAESYPELGWVDAEVELAEPYTPTGTLQDDYHCFMVDPELSSNEQLIGFEVEPDATAMVHHVLIFAVDRADAEAVDAADPSLGWSCFGGTETSDPQLLGGWVPGSPPTLFPENTGINLKAGQVMVMQMHYNLYNTGPVPDQTRMRLQYAREPVTPAVLAQVAGRNFAIPPNSTDYEVSAQVTLEQPLKVWGMAPHMHTLGSRIGVTYKSGGQEQCIIDIPSWDFHWQQFYFYQAPSYLSLKKGDVVTLSCVYDNPTDATVTHGEGTSDEMCLSFFYLTQ
ncbi:MAG: hypothetical protein ACKO6N_06140 [Myxococcota bacterium]